jgi:hypothetical protein
MLVGDGAGSGPLCIGFIMDRHVTYEDNEDA